MPAEKEEEEEDKKQTQEAEAEDGQPPQELAKEEDKQRDPDEAKVAEESIISYIHDVMDQVSPMLEGALETFGNFLVSQPSAEVFDDPGFLEKAGSAFTTELTSIFGEGTPILQAILPDLGSTIDQLMREPNAASFASELAHKVHEQCAFVRDNAQAILSNQWDELLDLAYEGSEQFIPVLHEMGLPMPNQLDQNRITAPLQQYAESYSAENSQKTEEAEEKKDGEEVSDEKKELAEEEKQEAQMEEEGEEKAMAS